MTKSSLKHLLSCLATACLAVMLYAVAPAQAAPQTYTNSLGMEFVLIPAGSFMMGCTNETECKGTPWHGRCGVCKDVEQPRHPVTITRPFYLGKYEVTQAQWQAVMGSLPPAKKSNLLGGNLPVHSVSWNDVQTFILRLNQREGVKAYRLPTEAEWEYAVRAGSTTPFHFAISSYKYTSNDLDPYAWYATTTGAAGAIDRSMREWHNVSHPRPVGQKQPNPWGLYDMYGNVKEWVWDRFGAYQSGAVHDPTGPRTGDKRVVRSCAYNTYALWDCRSATREGEKPDWWDDNLGFRLVYSPAY